MPETNKTWVRTPDIYGKPICIHELDYANGLYLAHSEEHPNESEPFETVIVSTDMSHWQHRTSSPERENSVSGLCIGSFNDNFVAVCTEHHLDGKKLLVMTSENGFDWHDKLLTEDVSENYEAHIVKSMGGGIVGCCTGQLVFSTDLDEWKFSKFTGKYDSYKAIDIAYFNSKFFVLLNKGDDYAIAYSSDVITYKYYDLLWSQAKPNCIETNNSQLIIVCSENLAERCAVMYTDTGTSPDWARVDIKMPHRSITNSLSNMSSATWFDNQWIIVGSVREWNNSRTMTFSYTGVIARTDGQLTPETVLTFDETAARDLSYVQVINEQAIAYGQAHPNGDNCFFILK